MRIIRLKWPAAIARYLGYMVLALAGLGLVLSCAGSPAPADPITAVAVQPSVTRGTFDSPVPAATLTKATIESPLPISTTAPPAVEIPEPTATATASLVLCTVRIVNTFPHDRAAYTQGLVLEDGGLLEGTGLNGQSTLRRLDLGSGEVLRAISLSPEYFGEGITIWDDRIVQLTWKSGMGFVYDRETFDLLDTFAYPTEGWGITHDGSRLIMSDGTATLHFWDPDTFAETGSVEVHTNTGPVTRLNELEYVEGKVFANIYRTDFIAIIDPDTGQVTAWLDLRSLLGPEDLVEPVGVLNGIAYDADSQRLFVTGKLWPKLFEIELISLDGSPAPITCR